MAVILVSAVWLTRPGAALAQSYDPVYRTDIGGVLAWQIVDAGRSGPFDNRNWESSLFGGVAVGWYWTTHLKTELDFGGDTGVDTYRGTQVIVNGRQMFRPSRLELSRRTLAISQQYQFLENAWFHPHIALGANVTWERQVERFDPILLYDYTTGRADGVQLAAAEQRRTERRLRPFVAGGFKAYMTPRAFFRADLRMAFEDGLNESLLRMGFGFDF